MKHELVIQISRIIMVLIISIQLVAELYWENENWAHTGEHLNNEIGFRLDQIMASFIGYHVLNEENKKKVTLKSRSNHCPRSALDE